MGKELKVAKTTFTVAVILLVASLAFLIYSSNNSESRALRTYIQNWNQSTEQPKQSYIKPGFLHSQLVGQAATIGFTRMTKANTRVWNSVTGGSDLEQSEAADYSASEASSLELEYTALIDSVNHKKSDSYTLMLAIQKLAYTSIQLEAEAAFKVGEPQYEPGDAEKVLAKGLVALQSKLQAELALEVTSIGALVVSLVLTAGSLSWEYSIRKRNNS